MDHNAKPGTNTEIFNSPGVSVPEMTFQEAQQYIFDIGILVVCLPGNMGRMDHQMLKGHLGYVTVGNLSSQGKRDAITFLKAATNISKTRGNEPGLAEAVARMKSALRISNSGPSNVLEQTEE